MRFWLSLLALTTAAFAAETKSALEADPSGWTDLVPGNGSLKDWTRIPDAKDPKLSSESPWRFDSARRVLICDGTKAGHEYLQYTAREYADFVLHVEWRFVPAAGEPRYNSGILFRNSADKTVWHQAQTGLAGGFLFGMTLAGGELKRVTTVKEMRENRVEPAGEWNTYEITAHGPNLYLWVNGAVVSEMSIDVPKGYIALEAEGFQVEFRNIKVKEEK